MGLAAKPLDAIRRAVVRWFKGQARDLPWRRTRDPFAVWVSEVMLQQTRVETVVPYFKRFMARFPSATHLADADEGELMTLWSGLGYYRRARLLQQGARELVRSHGGRVPEDPAARRALPGVGPYTAGAIGSIAFGRQEPIVDGNVTRVLARLFVLRGAVGTAALNRELWALAGELVRGPDPGALNQGLMELGATVCTPRAPKCLLCPVRAHCGAYREGLQAVLPTPQVRRAPKPVDCVVWVPMLPSGEVVLRKQEGPLFSGLWSLPWSERAGAEDELLACEQWSGVRFQRRPRAVWSLVHVLTHRRLNLEVHLVDGRLSRACSPVGVPPGAFQAVPLEGAESLGLNVFSKKVLMDRRCVTKATAKSSAVDARP